MSLPTADPYLPGHGDPGWSARHYELELDYDLAGNRLDGTATITAVALVDSARVVLDLAWLAVKKVTLDGRTPKWAHREHRLILTPKQRLRAGQQFTIVVRYAGKPRPLIDRHHGDAGWEELTDGVIVAGQPHGAPTWYPCNDRVDDKASYDIAVTAATNYTVVANGTLVRRTRRGSGETWHYRQTEPMPPYLATVQIGRYDLVDVTGEAPVPVTAAIPAGALADYRRSFGRQGEMIAYFSEVFGPYPLPAYTVVVTDDDLEIPLESQSLSTFGRNFLTGRWEQVRLVAHELAHQWFGNAVTMRRLQDIWLHEGFACYAEWLWSQAAGGDSADAQARRHHAKLARQRRDLVLADPGPELMFDDRVYKRGALTLHALRLTVGDRSFFTLLRTWVERHRGGSATTADFEELTAQVCGERSALFDAWLREKTLPELPPA
ncbi:MAG: M1 family metallopeptidase [Nocardioides sp.]|uniref:M1 family metallopeptidase n=1 Tax=Nocardioides sp. TaxID=35761 RepID=UPI0039E46E83